ncbi:MAG: hypothetical protein IKS04_06320, partial [Clostridia bacterium]|nr:hypothetical protein [Clostridia bacterium]
REILESIYKGIQPAVKECGFSPVYPDGVDKTAAPVTESAGRYVMEFKGENKAFRIEHFNNRIFLYGVAKEGEIKSADYVKLDESLLEAETANDKDIRYAVNNYTDTLVETFGTKLVKPVKSKLPAPVSKAQAKSGAVSYDPNTLANRFTAIYPELREAYKENCEKYGQFLAEDFFLNHGNAKVLEVIRRNNDTEMKRLFKLFNDIYSDGTNETQSLLCVTILGSLENDMELLANCTEYMSSELAQPVINVNKYLASNAGKGARIKLDNPPPYKPKKQKKSVISKIGM